MKSEIILPFAENSMLPDNIDRLTRVKEVIILRSDIHGKVERLHVPIKMQHDNIFINSPVKLTEQLLSLETEVEVPATKSCSFVMKLNMTLNMKYERRIGTMEMSVEASVTHTRTLEDHPSVIDSTPPSSIKIGGFVVEYELMSALDFDVNSSGHLDNLTTHKGEVGYAGGQYSVHYTRMDGDGRELVSICLRHGISREWALNIGGKLAEVLGLKENGTTPAENEFTEYSWMTIMPTGADEYVTVKKERR